ncbi:efflux RND transporter periplasmic adaptor subunit [Sideroxydans sp. CL21]|uniref:efflux RND transporter periplasmic adaptor subunit n=1 Tax=Sideroxydans sp. CL21 TaxID=2600596 RepID=UPI0012A8D60D|nr:efflux RND transporter periplasmic adaptor subunit [Sideroxydans sp. CL21]VVC83727.1 ABC transporter, RND-adapter-like protein [Sideroxydans sp. CL21]
MQTRISRNISIGIVLLLAGGTGIWWFIPKKEPAEARYATVMAERGSITQSVSANGTLNPVVLVSVGSQISGIVKKLHADFNDQVKAGQVLLELDPTLTHAQLLQSEANIANAQASLELAQANEIRTRGLFEQEYVTRQDLDTAVQMLKAAKAQLALAQAQMERDRTNMSYTVIRSPVSGVVVSRLVDVGQTVAASLQTPTLFQIAQDLSHMQIDTSYAEADVGNIRVGQQATFRVDAFPNRSFRGAVRQVRLNPTTQQNVVTYDVVVSVDNLDQVLMPGMTAYVNIVVAQRKDALRVPNAALRFRPGDAGPRPDKARNSGDSRPKDEGRGKDKDKGDTIPMGTVYVLEKAQPKAVRLSVGITDNRMTEVLGGEIKEGDAVVVEDRQPPAKNTSTGMRLF